VPRIRTFKPDMATSHNLARIPREVLYTWTQLWPHCDDKGRFYGDPRLVWAALYPLREDVPGIALLAELELLVQHGRVCCYRGCDAKVWLHILGWEHQKIDRPSESRIPPCRTHDPDDDCAVHGKTRCTSTRARFVEAAPVGSDDPQVIGSSSNHRESLASPTPDAGAIVRVGDGMPASRDGLATASRGLDAGPRTVDLGPRTVDQGMTAPRNATPTAPTRRGTRISEDFEVTAEMRAWARERGWTDTAIGEATEEFCDYWRGVPGTRGTKLDWPATWRTRLRDQERHQRSGRPAESRMAAHLTLIDQLAGREGA
jgi:hypothetical protein